MSTNNLVRTLKDIFWGSTKESHQSPVQEQYYPVDLNFSDSDPRNCVILIDASGSMDATDWKPSRLKAAIKAAEAFVNRMASENPDARIAVIAYSSYAQIILNFTPASHRTTIINRLNSIRPMDSTNIADALKAALKLFTNVSGDNQVILLTDGWSTEGNPKPIADKLKTHAIVETVGIGGSPNCVDEVVLKYIASPYPDGTKRYRWIGDTQQLVQHFHNLAGRLERARQ